MPEPQTITELAAEIGVEVDYLQNQTCDHVPPRLHWLRLEDFDPSVGRAAAAGFAAIRKIIAGDASGGLISGPVGCGKSMLAAIACLELSAPGAARLAAAYSEVASDQVIDRLTKALDRTCARWLNVPAILGDLRREIGVDSKDATLKVQDATTAWGLLVLDDLGADKPSEWVLEQLYAIVSTRYDNNRNTLATSNLTASRLTRAGYGRIVSRLAEDGVLVEMATAKDYRMTKRRSLSA